VCLEHSAAPRPHPLPHARHGPQSPPPPHQPTIQPSTNRHLTSQFSKAFCDLFSVAQTAALKLILLSSPSGQPNVRIVRLVPALHVVAFLILSEAGTGLAIHTMFDYSILHVCTQSGTSIHRDHHMYY